MAIKGMTDFYFPLLVQKYVFFINVFLLFEMCQSFKNMHETSLRVNVAIIVIDILRFQLFSSFMLFL